MLKAAYTVEAAWIISFCMILIGICLSVSIHMYEKNLSYIEETMPQEIDAVRQFRLFSWDYGENE